MKKEKKKILYIITKSNWGGAQRYVYDLAINLPEDKFEPLVIVGGEGVLMRKLSEKRVPVISIKSLGRDVHILRDFRAFRELLNILKKERPDVVHLNSGKASGLGALAARLRGVPCVIQTVHGWSFNEERSFLWRSLVWIASWVTALLAHKIIVVSRHDFEQAKKMPFVQRNSSCILNAISEQNLLARGDARNKISNTRDIPKGESAIWIGTIAELHKNKGLKYGMQAIKSLLETNSHIYWIVIGEGEDRRSLEESVRKDRLKKHVFLLGHKDDAAQYLKAFDVFMLPSTKEGLSYTLLEARSAGIPIVSTNIGGTPEIVKDTSGLIVPAKDPEKLAEAIEMLLSNPINLQSDKDDLKNMLEATISLY